MDADLDTLATALYVRVDDALKDDPSLAPWRPEIGIEPKLSDAELVTVAVMQALLGFTPETRWLRHARKHLGDLFPYLPGQSGYNKRLRRAAGLIQTLIRVLAADFTNPMLSPPSKEFRRALKALVAEGAVDHGRRYSLPSGS